MRQETKKRKYGHLIVGDWLISIKDVFKRFIVFTTTRQVALHQQRENPSLLFARMIRNFVRDIVAK